MISVFADTAGSNDLSTLITSITTPIKETFTLSNLGLILAAGLGIAVVFVLGWTAYRFIYRKAKGGLKHGE